MLFDLAQDREKEMRLEAKSILNKLALRELSGMGKQTPAPEEDIVRLQGEAEKKKILATEAELSSPDVTCFAIYLKSDKDNTFVYRIPQDKDRCVKLLEFLEENNGNKVKKFIEGLTIGKHALYTKGWPQTFRNPDRLKLAQTAVLKRELTLRGLSILKPFVVDFLQEANTQITFREFARR